MRWIPFLACMWMCLSPLQAQTEFGLVAFYPFDENDDTIVFDETGNLANNGISTTTLYDCGVEGRSIRFDGVDDYVVFNSTAIKDLFGTEDFSLSFYFKAFNSNQVGTQTLMSKRDPCSIDFAFAVRYTPGTQFINVLLSEDFELSANFIEPLDPLKCWHHVAIVRDVNEILLYLDGKLATSSTYNQRIDITTDDLPLVIGQSSCPTSDANFEGLMDEIRLYNRSLNRLEIEELYLRPDEIGNGFVDLNVNKDTILYLGNAIQTYITNTCADDFLWEPSAGVLDPTAAITLLEPETTTTYTLEFTDNFGCTAVDSFRVTVINPDSLTCKAFLPTAFTPNQDGLNETFGVDNPFALTDFISLEIFDRWGGLMFATNDPFARWDGTFKGSKTNPGAFFYQVRYRCETEELVDSGTVMLMR